MNSHPLTELFKQSESSFTSEIKVQVGSLKKEIIVNQLIMFKKNGI